MMRLSVGHISLLRQSRSCRSHRRTPLPVSQCYSSFFRSSVAERLRKTSIRGSNLQQESHRQEDSIDVHDNEHFHNRVREEFATLSREDRRKLVSKVEASVRQRLREEFPNAFGSLWYNYYDHNYNYGLHPGSPGDAGGAPPLATLSSFRTLLALNGFDEVGTPSGSNSDNRLYLAEGVVATPPMKLWFNAKTIPFASGYQEFAREMDLDNVGVFGDVRHLVTKPTQTKTRLFALPTFTFGPESTTARKRSLLPEFVQEDITVYRVLETSAAKFLDGTYSRWSSWTHRRFVRPMKDAEYRTRIAIKSLNAFQARVHQMLEKSLMERIWETARHTNSSTNNSDDARDKDKDKNNHDTYTDSDSKDVAASVDTGTYSTPPESLVTKDQNEKSIPNPTQQNPHSVETSPRAPADDLVSNENENEDEANTVDGENDAKEEEIDPLETLVTISSRPRTPRKGVVSRDGDEMVDAVVLYQHMSPATRILALPGYYVLRHSSASTLVSVSLVVFGALPLAYRSYIFSIDYDWLVSSPTIAASVIATISYGIYSARWRARTSQSKNLHEALGARLAARDEAALLLLREGAVRVVVRSVLEEAGVTSETADRSCGGSPGTPKMTLLDPLEWAKDFGLRGDPSAAADANHESSKQQAKPVDKTVE